MLIYANLTNEHLLVNRCHASGWNKHNDEFVALREFAESDLEHSNGQEFNVMTDIFIAKQSCTG